MVAVEYAAPGLILLGVAYLFIDIGFRIERKLESTSIIDFFDAIRFTFFAVGAWFGLMAINFGQAVIADNATNMSSIFDTTTIIYTLTTSLLIVFGFVYVFLIIPKIMSKLSTKRRREEEEVIR